MIGNGWIKINRLLYIKHLQVARANLSNKGHRVVTVFNGKLPAGGNNFWLFYLNAC